MAIQIADGFQLRVTKPLDDRQNVETIAQLDPTYGYEGQIVYVKDIKQFYTCYKDENGSLAYKVMETGAGGGTVYTNTPIGTVLSFAGQTPPNGYLLCDGGSYAVADYQDLYDVIGNTYGGDSTNFNVPDYRETVLVGVGENTTDTIATHDVYELGEFKDDQLQTHTHTETRLNTAENVWGWDGSSFRVSPHIKTQTSPPNNSRIGDTTHGKQKGVTYIIKAFHTNEGVDAPVELEDSVVNHINRQVDSKLVEDMSDYINERVEDRVTEVVHRLIEGTEYPTTETCPVGCWYGMYFE